MNNVELESGVGSGLGELFALENSLAFGGGRPNRRSAPSPGFEYNMKRKRSKCEMFRRRVQLVLSSITHGQL